jgi:hypothetical protein
MYGHGENKSILVFAEKVYGMEEYSFTHSKPLDKMDVCGNFLATAALPPGNIRRCSLNKMVRRSCTPSGLFGEEKKMSCPVWNQTYIPRLSSPHHSHYAD